MLDIDDREASLDWRALARPMDLVTIAGFGVAGALIAGAVDLATAFVPLPIGLGEPGTVGVVFAVVALKSLAGYALLSIFVLLPAVLLFGVERASICALLAFASVAATRVLWSFTDWVIISELWADLPIVLLIGWLIFLALRRGAPPDDGRFVVATLLAACVASLAVTGLVWSSNFPLRDLVASKPWLVVAPFGVVAAVIWLPVSWLGRKRVSRLVLTGAALVVTLMPARALLDSIHHDLGERARARRQGSVQHVILLTIDTLRYDAVSASGYPGPETPSIDRLAADGVLFRRAITPAPWTVPSIGSLMTGEPPFVDPSLYVASYDAFGWPRPTTSGSAPLPTLAGDFEEAGYLTRGFVANELLHRPQPTVKGLRRVDTYGGSPLPWASVGSRTLRGRSPGRYITGGSTRGLTDETIAWAREHRDDRFFLWVHYFDPHWPYAPPPEYIPAGVSVDPIFEVARDRTGIWPAAERARARILYDAEVRFVDHHVGRLLDELKSLRIYDDALIVLTSDHGEEFWEHDLFGHTHALHRELLQVPLLIKRPGSREHRLIDTFVPTISVMPTILDLCDIDRRRPLVWAESLRPILDRVSESYPAPIISSATVRFDVQSSVIVDDFKLIRRTVGGREELYDLNRDPGETRSVLEEHPEVAANARQILGEYETWANSLRSEYGIEYDAEGEADPEMLERLRALGYID